MKNSIYLLLFCVFVGLIACKKESAPTHQLVAIRNLYTLELPARFEPTYDMHESAELQYADKKSHWYLICMEDAKSNFGTGGQKMVSLSDYYKFAEAAVLSDKESKLFLQGVSRKQDGIKIQEGDYQVKTTLNEESIELLYRVTVLESKSHFFQLVMWMPYEDGCKVYEKMDSITRTFRLINDGGSNI